MQVPPNHTRYDVFHGRRSNRRCYNCRQVGHEADNCPLGAAGINAWNPPPPAIVHADLLGQGPPYFDFGDARGDLARRAEYSRITRKLYYQAEGWWATYDADSQADQRTVVRRLVQIAKMEKLYNFTNNNLAAVALGISTDAMRHAYVLRLQNARIAEVDPISPMGTFFYSILTYLQFIDWAPVRGGLVARVKYYESLPRLSRHPQGWLAWILATVIHAIAMPVIEEFWKRALPAMLHSGTLGAAHVGSFLIYIVDALGTGEHHRLDVGPEDTISVLSMLGDIHVFDLISLVLFVFVEAKLRVRGKPSLKIVFASIVRFMAHFILMCLVLREAIFIHVLWNMVVLLSIYCFGTSSQYLLDILASAAAIVETECCLEVPMKFLRPTSPDLRYKKGDEKCVPSFGCRVFWTVCGIVPNVWRGCIHNEERGIKARIGRFIPEQVGPLHGQTWLACRASFARIKRRVKRTRRLHPMEFVKYLAGFCSVKKERLTKIFEGKQHYFGMMSNIFIKREIAIMDAEKKRGDPRIISGSPEVLNVATGPYVKPATKELKKAMEPKEYDERDLRAHRHVTYMSGETAVSIGDKFTKGISMIEDSLDDDDELIFVLDDESRFDLHIKKHAFRFLMWLYAALFVHSVVELLRRKSRIRGRTSNGSKMSMTADMESGMPDTALADTALNSAMKYHIHGPGEKWFSIVMGDDSATAMSLKLYRSLGREAGLIQSYASFGMEITVDTTCDIWRVELCSSFFHPIEDGTRMALMPKLCKLIGRLLIDKVDRPPEEQSAWLRGIATTLEHFGKINHILAAMSRGIWKQVGTGRILMSENKYKIYHRGDERGSWADTLFFMSVHYGFSERDCLECVHELENLKLGELSSNVHLKSIIDKYAETSTL